MYRLGFDIGGTNIAYGLVDEGYELINKASVPFPHSDPEATVKLLMNLTDRVCIENGITHSELEKIGVCIPGSIDRENEIVINAYNLGFHNFPLRRMLEDTMDLPVQLMNDADAAAMAEYRLGVLANTRNAMMITIGTGIGGGIILNGKLYHGGNDNGIELGHMVMDLNGELCSCGRRGCVETLCAASYLNSRAKKIYDEGNLNLKNYSRENIDGATLIHWAQMGDKACLEVWNEYIENLAEAIASYINLFDPERIAIGGGICGAGDFLIAPLNRLSAEKCFFSDNPPEIVCAKLGSDAGIIGAVIQQ